MYTVEKFFFFDNKLLGLLRQRMRWFSFLVRNSRKYRKNNKQKKKHREFKFWERKREEMKKKEKRISERLYVHEMLITLESWQNFREKKTLACKADFSQTQRKRCWHGLQKLQQIQHKIYGIYIEDRENCWGGGGGVN